MSYSHATDFLALLRQTGNGSRILRMPGLDYMVEALARTGLFTLSVGTTAPTSDQATTVWLKPYNPSYASEGAVYLWNATAGEYQPATPALWALLLAPSSLVEHFQSVTTAGPEIVEADTTLLAIERNAPAATALTLPPVAERNGIPLHVVDWSTGVVDHAITLDPDGTETIMRSANLQIFSNAAQLVSVTLYPSINLNGWYTAP